MKTRIELYKRINENAAELNRLHRLVHETCKRRGQSQEAHQEWVQASATMLAQHPALCVPGGMDDEFYPRLKAGDSRTAEVALCFVELRPYFFRSGYLWKEILQKCKNAPLIGDQAERRDFLVARYADWKALGKDRWPHGADAKRRRRLRWILVPLHRVFPITLSSQNFSEVTTALDLYRVLCKILKIEPSDHPEKWNGLVHPARSSEPPHDMALWAREYDAWRKAPWTPGDVWATMVATIKDAFGPEEFGAITPTTNLLR
jgi:hypothetical protein